MNSFEITLQRLDEFCNSNSISYAVIGGLAVIAYGYQRTTKDIDITVLCSLESLNEIHKEFVKNYLPIYDNSLDFFNKNFVLPVKDKITDIKIDVAAGLTIFDDIIIKRRKRTKLGETEFYICTIEDLIIYKLFANRPQDFADVQIIINENIKTIDKTYLTQTAEKFREMERGDMPENLNKFLSSSSS